MNNREYDIIQKAILLLKGELGNRLSQQKITLNQSIPADATVEIDGHTITIEALSEIRPHSVQRLADLSRNTTPFLAAATYISPEAKKLLKAYQINYIDGVGNMWVKLDSLFIHIEAIPNRAPSTNKKNQAFTAAGVKVIFHLLNNPLLLHASYRKISQSSGVSLGTIPKVFHGLKEQRFLLKKSEKEWAFADVTGLLNRWQIAYADRLKPGLLIGRFRSNNPDMDLSWTEQLLQPGDQWGGEPGGDLLTQNLQPELFTLYSNLALPELMKSYRWIPDPTGSIQVYQKFWGNDQSADTNTSHAPALIVYADLLESGNPRCMEIANHIYEQYIQ